jgi:hypothetical protein
VTTGEGEAVAVILVLSVIGVAALGILTALIYGITRLIRGGKR